ncbi:MAG TPA: cytochrome c oxidase assembly protein [Ktedonobacteraceae bacterium]|nr:cytochrome c oxidase assembly protein [Ktedonobacteraceae bacterium]
MNIWVDANGWPVPPAVLLGCLAAEILYFRGWQVIVKGIRAKEAARARNPALFTGAPIGEYRWDKWLWHGIYFLGAIFALLLASSAPIDYFSGRLLWVHMIQHLLLLVVVAPLMVAAAPLIPFWLGLPTWSRRLVKKLGAGLFFYRLGQGLRHPTLSCALFIIGIWIWHWPALYDLALTNNAIHDWFEHTTFLAVSILFWSQVISSPPLYSRLGYLGRLGCVGFAIAQNVVLAALIGFAQVPLYAPYAHLIQASGALTALQDQQLGAGIMWTFGDLPFGIAFSVLLHRWLFSLSDDASADKVALAVNAHFSTQGEAPGNTKSAL